MNSWDDFLKNEAEQDYFKQIISKVQEDIKTHEIYPPHDQIFTAFKECPLSATKAVIIGMDPYHGPGQAHGLSFSVPHGVTPPPSLKNIFKELQSDLGISPPAHGNLKSWANQGILLLNSALTVRRSEPGSHKDIGWEKFLERTLNFTSSLDKPIVYFLWGNHAKDKRKYIKDNAKQLIYEAAHPSFYSCKLFFGCKHFSKANEFLKSQGQNMIDWKIE